MLPEAIDKIPYSRPPGNGIMVLSPATKGFARSISNVIPVRSCIRLPQMHFSITIQAVQRILVHAARDSSTSPDGDLYRSLQGTSGETA